MRAHGQTEWTDESRPTGNGTDPASELEGLRTENTQLWADAIAHADQIDLLNQMTTEQAAQLQRLEERDRDNTRRIEVLERDLAEARRQAGQHGQKAAQFEQALFRASNGKGAKCVPTDESPKLREELRRCASALERSEAAKAALEAQLDKTKAELEEALRTGDALRMERERLQEEYASRRRNLDAECRRFEHANEQSATELEALNAELLALRASSIPKAQAAEEMEAARKAILATEARHQAALQAQDELLATTRAELHEARRTLGQAALRSTGDQGFQAGFDKALRLVIAQIESLSSSGSSPSTAIAPPISGPDRAEVAAALADRTQALEAVKERLRAHHEDTEPEQHELNARLRSLKATRPRKGTPEAEEITTIEKRLEELRQEPLSFQREARRIEDECERLKLRLDAHDELANELPTALLAPYAGASERGGSAALAREHAHPIAVPPLPDTPNEPAPLTMQERERLFASQRERIPRAHIGGFLFIALLELIPEKTGAVTSVFEAARRANLEHPLEGDIPVIQNHVTNPPLATWLRRHARSGRSDWTMTRTAHAVPWHGLGRPLYSPDERQRFLAAYGKTG